MSRRHAVLFLAVFGTSACGFEAGDRTEIHIGLITPKTGPLESIGKSFERVFQAAVGTINSKGGVDGRPLVPHVEDTGTVKETVPDRLMKLTDPRENGGDGCIAVIGPATSGEVSFAYPIARDRQVPIISPSSTDAALNGKTADKLDDDGFLFRNVPDDRIQGVAMAYYLRSGETPVQNAVVVYEDTGYGKGLKDAFEAAFMELGGQIAGTAVAFPQRITMEGANEAVAKLVGRDTSMAVLIALEGDAVEITKAWSRRTDLTSLQWFMTDGARSKGFLDAAPPQVVGMCGTASTFPVTGLAYGELDETFRTKFPEEPPLVGQVYSANVWDAAHLFAVAMVQQARQFPDEPLGGPHLRDALLEVARNGQVFRADQWRNLVGAVRRGANVDYDGAAGPNDFDDNGEAVGPFEVWCIANTRDGRAFQQSLFLETKFIQDLVKPGNVAKP